jgi:hypothetical protein
VSLAEDAMFSRRWWHVCLVTIHYTRELMCAFYARKINHSMAYAFLEKLHACMNENISSDVTPLFDIMIPFFKI